MNDVNALQKKKLEHVKCVCDMFHVYATCPFVRFGENLVNLIYLCMIYFGTRQKKKGILNLMHYSRCRNEVSYAQSTSFRVWHSHELYVTTPPQTVVGGRVCPYSKILCLPRAWLCESVVLLLFIITLSWVYLGRLGGCTSLFSPGAAAFSLAFASFFGFCSVHALLIRQVVSGQQPTGLSFHFTLLRHCATHSFCVPGHL